MSPWFRANRPARWLAAGAVAVVGCAGCAGPRVVLPAGYLPPPSAVPDFQSAAVLTPPPGGGPTAPGERPRLELHGTLPGAAAPPIAPPKFGPNTPAAEKEKAIRAAFPQLAPVAATGVVPPAADGRGLSLTDLQQMAAANSPVLRRAAADAQAAYGPVIQAGLHPNPTAGYQVDAWQPGLGRQVNGGTGAGQQGGYVSQLIKTAGKLTLAQKVAGFDYLNAVVAVRRAEVDTVAKVRAQYFAVLVAEQSVAVNRALVDLADEVYAIELRQVAAGEAAAYEPLQVYAQAEQIRNAVTQAEQHYRAAWKQLAAAVGRPDLPPTPLAGRADAPAPVLAADAVAARMLDRHTDLLTARNAVAQAEVNLVLQKRQPVPDLATYSYHEYDNLAQQYQFGMQIGVQLPISDRNQGNIRQAAAKIARARADVAATENDLLGRLAEAHARYEANRVVAGRYRDKILPNLTRAYRAITQRNQVEPEKVGFNDIVVAQQNLGQAMQAYLAALDAQWKAVVDVANLGQLDELYPADAPK